MVERNSNPIHETVNINFGHSNNHCSSPFDLVFTCSIAIRPPKKANSIAAQLYDQLELLLDKNITLFAETGDTWANTIELNLPTGCLYEIQLQYASIGWSVGATLGYAIADNSRRVITCIGDGSLQMTAQEISTMIRYGLNPIIIVVNNHGYLIERLIHDGPYNDIQNWSYSKLIDVFNSQKGNGWGCTVTTSLELAAALENARKHNGLCLIEVITKPDDANKHSIEFAKKVAAFNNSSSDHRAD